MDPVGTGAFAMTEDRDHLAPIVQQLLSGKLQRLLDRGCFEECRHLLSWSDGLVRGLPSTWQDATPSILMSPSSEGEASLRWPPTDGDMTRLWGPCPLHVAAGLGDISTMLAMLSQRADVASRQQRDVPGYFCTRGQQAIHVAALHGHDAAAAVLLQSRAGVDALDGLGQSPNFHSTHAGACSVVRLLLQHRARLDITANIDADVMETAAVYGRGDLMKLLLAAGASCLGNTRGFSALHTGATFRSGSQEMRCLVSARACLERRVEPHFGTKTWILISSLSLSYRLGSRSFLTKMGYHTWGCTPVMTAVIFENYGAAQELIRARADVKAKTGRGLSLLQHAHLFCSSDSPLVRLIMAKD